ncbi:DNA repair protein rad52 [Kickxella alabastrina]|nr:DNA repair protein rad52 [Kickxella alabastrina]
MSQYPTQQPRGGHESTEKPIIVSFEDSEARRMQATLRKKLGPEHVSTRQGMGNSRLSYIEGWRIISIANEIFGFNGWRSSIQNLAIDFMDMSEGGRFNIGASCVVRVTLKDGTYREDVGFGMIENTKSKGQGLEKVKKEATTDALKRAMRQFGNVLGNCVYDKEFLKNLGQVPKQARELIQGDALFRYGDLEDQQNGRQQRELLCAAVQPNSPQDIITYQNGAQQNGAQHNGIHSHPQPPQHPQFQSANNIQRQPMAQPDAHRRIVGQHVNVGVEANFFGNGSLTAVDDNAADFDMDGLDDEGVLDMIEDLETDRPIIFDSPACFGRSGAFNPQQQQQTPANSGNLVNKGSWKPSSVPVQTNFGNNGHSAPGLLNNTAAQVQGGAHNASGVVTSAARNLGFQHQEFNQQNQQQLRQQPQLPLSRPAPAVVAPNNAGSGAGERVRSFADISSFLPTTQNSTPGSTAVVRLLSETDGSDSADLSKQSPTKRLSR